jgi:hypothetical protein
MLRGFPIAGGDGPNTGPSAPSKDSFQFSVLGKSNLLISALIEPEGR